MKNKSFELKGRLLVNGTLAADTSLNSDKREKMHILGYSTVLYTKKK